MAEQQHNLVSSVFYFPFFFLIKKEMDTSQLYSGSNGGGRRRRSREIETLSLEIRKYPRDLLHTFLSADPVNHSQQRLKSAMEEKLEGEIELNLGLSLGGRFGVDRSHNGLIRASSIAGTMPILRAEEVATPPAAVAALVRTASLPVETDEEWRRRKEMQTLRRMEAKRRRSEKQRNSSNGGGTGEERESGLSCKGRQLSIPNPGKSNPGPGLPGQCGAGFGSLQGLLGQQQLQGGSQGSGESYGGGSSGVSELESKTHQGSGSCGEARSPVSAHSTQERGSQEPSPMGSSSGTKHIEGSSKQSETSDHKKKEASTGGIEDMPCVFTIGDGPNGRKVDGILYKYGKGKEVRIMCVCHGSFFSPAEFVKHAGCSDVEHPLRHIVVNPSPSSFL